MKILQSLVFIFIFCLGSYVCEKSLKVKNKDKNDSSEAPKFPSLNSTEKLNELLVSHSDGKGIFLVTANYAKSEYCCYCKLCEKLFISENLIQTTSDFQVLK